MHDELQRQFSELIARMQRGERSAFEAFCAKLGRVLELLWPFPANSDINTARKDWMTEIAVAVARPGFEIPKDLLAWVFSQMESLAQELAGLGDLQRRIVSISEPPSSGLEIGVVRRAKYLLSGDFVDVFGGTDTTRIILGDSMGHGPVSAYYGNTVLATLRSCLHLEPKLREAMRRANEILRLHRPGREYAVAQVALWELGTRTLHLVNAGLTVAPITVLDGVASQLPLSGLALGWLAGTEFDVVTLVMPPKSILVMASDGIVEQTNSGDADFGFERLMDSVSRRSHETAQQIAQGILDDVDRHATASSSDDQTVLVVRF